MRKLIAAGVLFGLGVALALSLNPGHRTVAAEPQAGMIVHDVYFTLNDNSPQSRAKLVAACKKYLTKHPGEVFFAAGTIAEDLKRDVNDRDFDVGLHIVFQDKKAHDAYQDAPRHKQFIDENKASWKKVRVFDTVATP